MREVQPEIPVFFITGLAGLDRLRSAAEAGVVLQKPFKATDLAAKLTLIVRGM
jgi:hypothetical protein